MSNIDKQDRQVSRYDLVSGYMQKWPDGEFVYHSDYQALLDELEAKDKQIGDLKATAAHSSAGWKEAHEQEARAEAAEKRIAELERKEQHSERQSVIDALASSGEEWSDIEEYMQKWDAERASAAGKGE
jgi:predicted RNase H-like nuclease (RuvC/YqgF family)